MNIDEIERMHVNDTLRIGSIDVIAMIRRESQLIAMVRQLEKQLKAEQVFTESYRSHRAQLEADKREAVLYASQLSGRIIDLEADKAGLVEDIKSAVDDLDLPDQMYAHTERQAIKRLKSALANYGSMKK